METRQITQAIEKLQAAERQLNQVLRVKDKPVRVGYTHIQFGYHNEPGIADSVKFHSSDCPPHLWDTAVIILETHFREAVATAEKELRQAMTDVLNEKKDA